MPRTTAAGILLAALLHPVVGSTTPFWGAHESRPPETSAAELEPGEFVWNPRAAQIGPILVLVSLTEQHAYVYRNGVKIGVTTISSGKPGRCTPAVCRGIRRPMAACICPRSSPRNCSPSRRWA